METHQMQMKMKKQFDYMTSDVLKERKKHMLASIHLGAWGNVLFAISAIITLSQAGLAVIAQAKNTPDHIDTNVNISIALLAAFSVFWQSLIKHFDFSGKAMAFDSASSALGKIYNVALMKAREEKANMSGATITGGKGGEATETEPQPDDLRTSEENNAEKSEEDEEAGSTTAKPTTAYYDNVHPSNVLTTLTKQFEQAIESCPVQVPVKIAAAFELLDNRVGACKKKIDFSDNKSCGNEYRVEWEKVYPSLYRQLTATIISQRFWPYFYPNPEKMVDIAMKTFEESEPRLLKVLLLRGRTIDEQFKEFEPAPTMIDNRVAAEL
jgi:hypothetical protein